MILYLSRNENAHLLDNAAREKSLLIRKMSGSFTLSEFIALDMRKYASCQYFCVERSCTTEKDGEFVEALKSFQMMYSARVIIINENAEEGFIRELAKIGVTDIVTAADTDEKLAQTRECLSDEGMKKQKPKTVNTLLFHDDDGETDDKSSDMAADEPIVSIAAIVEANVRETQAQSRKLKKMEKEHYRFDCLNVKIGVIGATRRVGTTTIALGLVNFIQNHGGTACYVAPGANQHLNSIAATYNFDALDDYYTFNAIDFYEGMLPKHDYNFIVSDFGETKREAVRKYKESDIHLLCGASGKAFEIDELGEAYKQVRSVKPRVLIYAPDSDSEPLIKSAVPIEPTIIKPVGNMLDFKVNGIVFKGFIKEYIVETSKRL